MATEMAMATIVMVLTTMKMPTVMVARVKFISCPVDMRAKICSSPIWTKLLADAWV